MDDYADGESHEVGFRAPILSTATVAVLGAQPSLQVASRPSASLPT